MSYSHLTELALDGGDSSTRLLPRLAELALAGGMSGSCLSELKQAHGTSSSSLLLHPVELALSRAKSA